MIRQGVAGQDRQAVRSALELARQLQTPIEQPILDARAILGDEFSERSKCLHLRVQQDARSAEDMLKKWLGEDAFNAAMGAPKAAQPGQPPLVLIREGVAAQNKDAVRSALRLAVEQESKPSSKVRLSLKEEHLYTRKCLVFSFLRIASP